MAENIPAHSRGGVGVKAAAVSEKTGPVVAVHTLDPEATEVIMMSTKGQAIRIAVKEIPTQSRATQGVRIMRLNDGDTVASIGVVLPDVENSEQES